MAKKIIAIILAIISNLLSIIFTFVFNNGSQVVIYFTLIYMTLPIYLTIRMIIDFHKQKRVVSRGVLIILFVSLISGILYLCVKTGQNNNNEKVDTENNEKKEFVIDDDNKERIYLKAKQYIDNKDIDDLVTAKKLLNKLDGYKDSKTLIETCNSLIKELNKKESLKQIKIVCIVILCICLAVGGLIINNYVDHKVIYDTLGGSTIETIKYSKGDELTLPLNPTKEGYIFAGWDKELPEKMPAKRVKLRAIWQETGKVFSENGNKYIYFGTYPQNKVNDDNIKMALDELSQGSNKKDKIYEYNGNQYTKYNDQYYQVNPLKWQIIEENEDNYKIISVSVLTSNKSVSYSSLDYFITKFYSIYFTEEEQSRMIEASNGSKINNYGALYDKFEGKPLKDEFYYALITDYADANDVMNKDGYAVWYTGYTEYVNFGSYEAISYDLEYCYNRRILGEWGIRPVIIIQK